MKLRIQAACILGLVTFLTLPLGIESRKDNDDKNEDKKPKPKPPKGPPSEDEDPAPFNPDKNCNQNDVILAWNRIALDANVRDHNGLDKPGDAFTETMGPPASAVQLAKVHLAMLDAHNSIAKDFSPAVIMIDDDEYTEGASINAAVATAAYQVLIMAYPLQADYFMTAWQEWLDNVSDESAKRKGIQVGSMVASSVIVDRMGDGTAPGSAQVYEFTEKSTPGSHQLDPIHPNQGVISPQAGNVKPFFINEAFLPPDPPALDLMAYTEAYNQVKTLGGDNITTPTTRTVMESVIGWYWSYNASPKLGTPPRLCNEIARTVACQMENTVSENARLFAMINGGLSDAGMSSWASKFKHNYWRPVIGIRNGNVDGNPNTKQDVNWKYLGASRSNPLVDTETSFTPPFPAYTSGHATFCGVTFKMLANFYGTNDIAVSFRSQEFDGDTQDDAYLTRPCLVQTFDTLSQMTAQCAASRVFNGVHWSFDGSEGAKIGEALADAIFEKMMAPMNAEQPTKLLTDPIEDEIRGILERAVSPQIVSCSDGEDDSTALEIVEHYFSNYQDQKSKSERSVRL